MQKVFFSILLQLSLFSTAAIATPSASPETSITESARQLQSSRELGTDKLNKAIKLIVDGYAEDKVKVENLLIDTIRLIPSSPEPYVELARYMLWQVKNGMLDVSSLYRITELAHIANELSDSRPMGQFLVCEVLLATDQIEAAQNLYETIKRQYPHHLDTYTFEARFFIESNPAKALEAAQKALQLGQAMDRLSPAIIDAIVKNSTKDNAAENLERFANVYPDRWIWHRAAGYYVKERKYALAENAYLKAIELGNTFESQLQYGILAYTHMKNLKKSVHLLARLQEQLSRYEGAKPENIALVNAHLAVAYLEDKQFRKSTDAALTALRFGSTNPSIANSLMSEFEERKQQNALKGPLLEFVKHYPTAEYAHIMLGNLSSAAKQYASALSHFSNAILLAPERDDLYSARGHAWYFTARYDEALKDFEQAIRFHPQQATYYYNRACMLVLLGRHKDALQDLKSALNLNQNLIDLAKKDTDLKALRRDESMRSELASLGI